MTLSQLRYFLEVCRHENITQAAEKLHVAQPSVTVAIRELEEELGTDLFRRVKRRIHLTNEGRFFFAELSGILDKLDSLTDTVRNMGEKNRLVKIGIGPMIGTFLFPRIFSGFKKSHPEIALEVSEYGALELQKRVYNETLDLAMVIRESQARDDRSFKAILSSSIRFYVHPQNPLAERVPLSLADLRHEPLVLFGKDFYLNRVVTAAFEEQGIAPNVILITNQINTIKRFVRENIASTFLIRDCVEELDGLQPVELRESFAITVGLEWKQGRYLGGNVEKFLDFVDALMER